MSEKIITEAGEIKIEQTPQTPEPIKTGLANGLKQILTGIFNSEKQLDDHQAMLDRICLLLTDEQWEALAITQIKQIAVRNDTAASYLLRIGAN